MKKNMSLILSFTLILLTSCTTTSQNSQSPSPSAVVTGSDDVVAKIGDEKITDKEVTEKASTRMMKLLSQMYDIKKQALDEMIDEKLLEKKAKEKNVSLKELYQEITKDVAEPTDQEAKVFYEMQKNRMFRGKDFEDVKNSIKAQLKNQKQSMAINQYLDQLRKEANVAVFLERPSIDVSVDDDPAKGNPDAPIKLIEFSEFQCPFCKRTRPTIAKILEKYGDKVYYVFRDFPLSFHKQAKPAANAAECAHEQNKFWEFSDKLWEKQSSLGKETYFSVAKDVGLNMDQFTKCYDSNKYYKEIRKDQQDGMAAGVSGTPAYFINGKFLSGAQPFPAFEEIIEEELAKK